MLNGLFNRSKQNPEREQDQTEYIQYAQEVESTLRLLEAQLHESDDAGEIIQMVLKTACNFYQGDWVGFLEVDLEMDLWTPYVWYNPHGNDQTEILLAEVENFEPFKRWLDVMHNNSAVCIPATKELKDAPPEEAEMYQRLKIRSALAVPIKPRPTGFLVVRNPQRYLPRSSMLKMLAFVLLASINEQKLMQSMKMTLSPDSIERDTDVIINLFGNLEIYTAKGVLRESDLKSPKICRLLAYIAISRKATIPAREIVEAVWPDEALESDNPGKNLRALIFRLRQSFSLISSYSLIETTPTGYGFNPMLNIITDLDVFEKYWDTAQRTSTITEKVEILKRAVDLYKGGVLESASDEHWLIPKASYYSLRYQGMVGELLKTLSDGKDYHNLHRYAAQALAIDSGNGTAHYWLIYSMAQRGANELAKAQVQIAKENLTDEDYHELVNALKKAKIAPAHGLLHRGKQPI